MPAVPLLEMGDEPSFLTNFEPSLIKTLLASAVLRTNSSKSLTKVEVESLIIKA